MKRRGFLTIATSSSPLETVRPLRKVLPIQEIFATELEVAHPDQDTDRIRKLELLMKAAEEARRNGFKLVSHIVTDIMK